MTQEKRRKLQKKSNLKNKDRGEAAVRFAVSVCRLSTSFLLFLFVCLFVAWFERLTVGCLMSSRKMEEKKGGCGREAFLFFFSLPLRVLSTAANLYTEPLDVPPTVVLVQSVSKFTCLCCYLLVRVYVRVVCSTRTQHKIWAMYL